MGAPTSSIFSEMYLQYLEDTKLLDILTRHHILGYFRYVDDILVVYDSSDTDIHTVLDQFNDTTPTLTFTMEMEEENIIFLDISILKNNESFEFKIYRKPTATDTISPSDSNHPPEHKHSAIRYLLNRLHSYPITDTYRQVEYDIIRHILRVNQYCPSILNRIQSQIPTTPLPQPAHDTSQHTLQQQTPQRFATFTYVGKETRFITKLFKHTNVRIAYRTQNTIAKLLRHHHNPKQDDHFDKSGIYQLSCPDCGKAYVGQTVRSFRTRFREHLRDYRYKTGNSKFAQHLREQNHSFHPINSVMDLLEILKKGAMMDTLERYHIYKVTNLENQINDKSTATCNILFDTLLRHDVPRGLPKPCINGTNQYTEYNSVLPNQLQDTATRLSTTHTITKP